MKQFRPVSTDMLYNARCRIDYYTPITQYQISCYWVEMHSENYKNLFIIYARLRYLAEYAPIKVNKKYERIFHKFVNTHKVMFRSLPIHNSIRCFQSDRYPK